MATLDIMLNVFHLLDVQLNGATVVFVQSLKGSCTNTDMKHLPQTSVRNHAGAGIQPETRTAKGRQDQVLRDDKKSPNVTFRETTAMLFPLSLSEAQPVSSEY